MQSLTGFTALLLAQAAGEITSGLMNAGLGWALPGPVLGMLFVLAALALPVGAHLVPPLAAAAEPLMKHLSLLFVPVGVGVVARLGLVAAHGWRLALVLVLSTLAGLLCTAWVLHALWPKDARPGNTT
jgi:holin-like protein